MTIDEAIEKERHKADKVDIILKGLAGENKEKYKEECLQLADWLEELKELKQLKDEAIKKYERLFDNKDFKQLAEWLKELKGVKENNHNFFDKCVIEAYQQGRADADKLLKQWKYDVVNSFCKFDASSVEELYEKGRADERARIIENINSYTDMLVEALNDKEENPALHEALISSRADEIRIRKLIIEQLKEKKNCRADTIKECYDLISEAYKHNLYCIEDYCEKEEYGYDCEDCFYKFIKNTLKEKHGNTGDN